MQGAGAEQAALLLLLHERARPRRQVLQLLLMTALHTHCGAYVKDSKLIVRLGSGERAHSS